MIFWGRCGGDVENNFCPRWGGWWKPDGLKPGRGLPPPLFYFTFLRMIAPLWPPNPKVADIAASTFISIPLFGT